MQVLRGGASASGGKDQRYQMFLTYPSAYGNLIDQLLNSASPEERNHPIVQGFRLEI